MLTHLRRVVVFAGVLLLLGLAIMGLAGVAIDNVFGWGVLGFSGWMALVSGVEQRIHQALAAWSGPTEETP